MTSGIKLDASATMTVDWCGFNPGPAYLYVCEDVPSVPEYLPRLQGCYGETLVRGTTAADGTGRAEVPVRTALYPLEDVVGTTVVGWPGGEYRTDCRGPQLGYPTGCGVVVTECSVAVSADFAALDGYEVVAGQVGSYDDDPFTDVRWIDEASIDSDNDGQPGPGEDINVDGILGFVARYSRTEEPPPPDPPPPDYDRPTGPRIVAAGSDMAGAAYNEWLRGIAQTLNMSVEWPRGDYAEGIDEVAAGSVDVAFVSAPATQAQLDAAAAAGQSLVYVPISASAIAVAHNIYPLLPVADLRVSTRSLAGFLWPDGQPLSNIGAGSLAADQGRCSTGTQRQTTFYTRAGTTEGMVVASTYLERLQGTDAEPNPEAPPWDGGVVDVLTGSSTFQGSTTHQQIGPAIAKKGAGAQTQLGYAARIGLLDAAWVQDVGVSVATVENAAGAFVSPSAAAATVTLNSSIVRADGFVDVDVTSADAAAYPLVAVNYAVVPANQTKDFSAADAENLRQVLGFLVSPEGQRIAAQEGLVPLTPSLIAAANTSIAKMGKPPPAVDTSTTTIATTAAASTDPAAPAPAAPAGGTSGGGRSSGGGSGGGGGSSGSGGRTTTTAPNVPARTATPAATPPNGTTPAPAAPGGSGPALPGRPIATVSDEQAGPPPVVPPDVFDKLFDAVPSAPDLPVLGAAGAGLAVAGQGLNLWRVSRKRPQPPTL